MKRNIIFIWTMLAGLLLVNACKKPDHSLGDPLATDLIKFDIVQDFNKDPGGNTVYLINQTPGTVPMWDYGTGKSIRQIDTVRFAFKGDYVIRFSAATGGGIVEKPSVTIKVTQDNLNYVNDPLWILLAGGPGNEKTWVLDANANGDKKKYTSPIYFAGMDNAYGTKSDDGQTVFWGKVCTKPDGPNCWTYDPNYTSDTWAAEKRDYGHMTFSLKGGPFLTTDHKGVAGYNTESGTYFLDINTLTLTTTSATPLFVSYSPNDLVGLNSWKILSLTEDFMQLAAKNKSKDEYQVLNFMSKTYSDNWTPPPTEEPKPDSGYNPVFAPGELMTMLTGGTSSGRFWQLDATGNPVDWIAKGIGWTTGPASSDNWGWNAGWTAAVSNAWIRFDNIGGNHYTRYQNGATTNGTFSINEATNEITLSGNTLLLNPDSWMSPTNNVLKVVKAFPLSYRTSGIWFGTSYDATKDEWLSFHYVIP
ncbi:hypothetical protein [Pseudobacter ginsenosidimutans]|uniref:PKD domain-containing protein n=1 Tax=Pseudobacter ginsenosidimutans TaxID=661488 RepID=A0A4Q7MG93_9BACT|nr:hypothetical protein [Pseudobacter ginsenosidimutans]QEC45583.1 hypothetical protein FSB84_29295 [Pseudobacter ginsenosidimutans]RZS67131.1 hypothetical protein EV199_5516 [Pseudobacter ginsenosidimutans]